jgi:uncharacterized MAPEG superfamily protein
MNATAAATLGYIGWTLALIVLQEGIRTWLVLSGRRQASGFAVDGSDLGPFMHRLARAHANCYEHFPIIAGPMLLALATGHAAITGALALWMLGARVVQSTVHLISISNAAVFVRFTFFAIQMAIAVWWVIQLWQHW